ncbi:MAG TPA: hypothetical protein VF102_10360, partial [Gemmatimonadaceae bacterium]
PPDRAGRAVADAPPKAARQATAAVRPTRGRAVPARTRPTPALVADQPHGPVPNGTMPGAAPPAAAPTPSTTIPPALSSPKPAPVATQDSAAASNAQVLQELHEIRNEIEARKRHVDSLTHALDSLKKGDPPR